VIKMKPRLTHDLPGWFAAADEAASRALPWSNGPPGLPVDERPFEEHPRIEEPRLSGQFNAPGNRHQPISSFLSYRRPYSRNASPRSACAAKWHASHRFATVRAVSATSHGQLERTPPSGASLVIAP
jgi:hypothetical protein